MLCHDEAHNVYKSKVRYFFPKKSPFGASLVQNYATLYLMIVCKDFLKHFIMMKQKMCSKRQFVPNSVQSYATLYLIIT